MKIAINAVASSAGGGRTYLLNLLRLLPALRPHEYEVWVPAESEPEFRELAPALRIRSSALAHRGFAGRLLWEQFMLPRQLARENFDVLICLGNFCPLASPVPVVLISANALYFSRRFRGELWRRRHFGWLLRHLGKGRMAVWSSRAAGVVVTPSRAMADLLEQASPRPVRSLHCLPFGPHQVIAAPGAATADAENREFRFLILSFYNYFRNFETVFQAMAILRQRTARPVRLLLSTRLEPGLKLGGYDTTAAYNMLKSLELDNIVECIGHVPYARLAETYASADLLICPGYIESFSFTVLEGMAGGLPVLASGIPAHREIGGPAVEYFSTLDPEDLAAKCLALMDDPARREQMSKAGTMRAREFRWEDHFQALLDLAEGAAH
jgi:glycosyltransferase involved in cell wall biosynthesis